jgi:hypothetical protein
LNIFDIGILFLSYLPPNINPCRASNPAGTVNLRSQAYNFSDSIHDFLGDFTLIGNLLAILESVNFS